MRLPVTSFAFDEDTELDSAFSRSTVTTEQAAAWADHEGVPRPRSSATPSSTPRSAATAEGPSRSTSPCSAWTPTGWLAPDAARGSGLGEDPLRIVVSATVAELGVGIGDFVTIDRIGTRLTVVGITADQHTFGHVDVAYVPLRTWQEIHAGAAPGEEVRPETYEEATAVAVLARDAESLDLGAIDTTAGTSSRLREESFGASPGYTAETATLNLIEGVLYVISALLIGAFFTVWTINRRHELAVIRAMGATAGHLVRDTIGQAAVVLVTSTAIGVGAGALLSGSAMPSRWRPARSSAPPSCWSCSASSARPPQRSASPVSTR